MHDAAQNSRSTYDLSGRTAVISGAAGGVAAATVKLLAEAGANVHGLDIDGDGLSRQSESLATAGHAITYTTLDIADGEAVAEALAGVRATYGGIDAVIASHGLNSVEDDVIDDHPFPLFQRILDINLGGVYHLARHSAPSLRESDNGVFLAVSSIAAHQGPAGPAYAAAKGGIAALVRILATQFAIDGVRAVTVTPGAIDTQMMRRSLDKQGLQEMVFPRSALQRAGQPEEVARLIRFLVSDDASYITGSNVTIDGGLTPF